MPSRLPELNITGLIEGGHHYYVVWTDDQAEAVLRTLGKWAASPLLPFTWLNAVKLSQSIREQAGAVRKSM